MSLPLKCRWLIACPLFLPRYSRNVRAQQKAHDCSTRDTKGRQICRPEGLGLYNEATTADEPNTYNARQPKHQWWLVNVNLLLLFLLSVTCNTLKLFSLRFSYGNLGLLMRIGKFSISPEWVNRPDKNFLRPPTSLYQDGTTNPNFKF